MAISYEEVGKPISSNTGNLTLRREDVYQHSPRYIGIYSEFVRDDKSYTSRPYILEYLEASEADKLLLKMFKSRYAKMYTESCRNRLL